MKIRPGIVTSSEIRKNQRRLPTMSNTRARLSEPSPRTRAGARDELLRAHAVEARFAQPALGDEGPQDRSGDDARAEHRDEDAQDQDEGEAADRRRAEEVQDRGRDQARHVRVEDRVPGPPEAG